jgi:hypothetical protein
VSPLRHWNSFWFGRVSARPLGAFRILVGLIVLAHIGLIALDMTPWLTDAGYLRGSEARELAGPLRLSPLQWLQDPTSVRLFLAATAVAAVAFTFGWRTRTASVLVYLGVLSMHHRMMVAASGADILLVCTLFYMVLSPCGAAYSLDARREARRRGTIAEPLIVPWAQRLIQFQVCILYFMTAVLKCNGSTWPGGTAIYYVMHNPDFSRWTLGLAESPVVLNVLTHAALLIEFGLAFLLWFKAARPYAIAVGVALHVGIFVGVNIPLFEELMVASYLTFLTRSEFDTLLRCLNPLRWFPPLWRSIEWRDASWDRADGAVGHPHFDLSHRTRPLATKSSATTTEADEDAVATLSAVGR